MSNAPATSGTSGSTKLIIGLAIGGGVLLIVVIALIFYLLGRNSGEPLAAATETASATPTPTPTPTPTETDDNSGGGGGGSNDDAARFTGFTAAMEVACDAGTEDEQPPKPEIMVSWTSEHAIEAWYSPSNKDAKDDNYMQVPVNGSQADFTDEHLFPCFHETESDYTITLVGQDGVHVSRHWTVRNVGDQ